MNAVIDWGNTRVKLGLFEDEVLREVVEVENHLPDTVKKISDVLSEAQPVQVIWSASGEVTPAAQQLFDDWRAESFTHQTPVTHTTLYESRNTLGLDRILLVEAAHHEFPDLPTLIIDMGTCITYDMKAENGVHLGGSIAPGWRMRLQAMHHFTARLPLSHAEKTDLLGVDTNTALQSGAYNGMLNELNETIHQYEQRFPHLCVIISGGDAQAFDLRSKNDIFARPNYTLHGLNAILRQHAQ